MLDDSQGGDSHIQDELQGITVGDQNLLSLFAM